MHNYLRSLPQRSDAHQRAFALAVSGGVTLIIFAVWSFVSFGNQSAVATKVDNSNLAAANVSLSPTPFQDILTGIKTSFSSIEQNLSHINPNGQ